MKHIILIWSLSLLPFFSSKAQTPDKVKATFQKMYPDEKDPDWDKDSNGNYESHFKINGVKYRADFSPDGSWIETETSVEYDDLPEPVKKVIEKKYSDQDITEIEKVEHHSKGLFYDVEFKKDGKNKDVMIRENGEIINK